MATIHDKTHTSLDGSHGITRQAIDKMRRIIDEHPGLTDADKAKLRSQLVPDDVIVAPEPAYPAQRPATPHRRHHYAATARTAV